MNINKKQKLLLIADRGRSDVAVRLGFLAQKMVKRKNINSHVLYEHKQMNENKQIFNLFDINNRTFVGIKFDEFFLILKTLFFTSISILKIFFLGFDWFVKNFEIEKIKLGDLIYDRYVRKGHNFINPNCFKFNFISLLFKSLFKFFYVKRFIKNNDVKFSLIGSITYISISSILMRISQFYSIPVVYVSGESFRIIKDNKNVGDILSKFIQKKIKSLNQKDLKKKSEKYFDARIQGKLTTKKYDLLKYYQHDEQTWITNRQDNYFIKKIRKIKQNYSHLILYAPHNFAESNHRCGDLIFRDFYQQTLETLKFAKTKRKILWLFKIHPYSQKKYGELNIAQDVFDKFKSENILMVPSKTSNQKLFELVDLVVSSRGTICLEAATFGVKNLINSDIFYDYGNISIRVKNRKKYFRALTNVNKLKNIDEKSILSAKKILYFRKKLQRDNPYNLVTARKLISKKEFFNKLKKSIHKTSLVSNNKNKMYAEIVNKL